MFLGSPVDIWETVKADTAWFLGSFGFFVVVVVVVLFCFS